MFFEFSYFKSYLNKNKNKNPVFRGPWLENIGDREQG